MNKRQRQDAIRARAAAALKALYHNATLPYGWGDDTDQCAQWLADLCEDEIEYLSSEGAHGSDYRATLAAPCNAGQYRTQAARDYYIRKGLQDRDIERTDCGTLNGWRVMELAAAKHELRVREMLRRMEKCYKTLIHDMTRNDALWERISEYGKLYTWGRGGRTLAPDRLVERRGGSSFSLVYKDNLQIAEAVELIRVVESFNRMVRAWCASVPEQWREHCAEEAREAKTAKNQAAARARIEAKERRYWAARGVITKEDV